MSQGDDTLRAITRRIGPDMADCELSFVERAAIDVVRAAAQHHAYVVALRKLGCAVIELPPLAGYPDAVFVEDTAVVVPELAVSTNPGAASRRGEVASVAKTLSALRRVVAMLPPATVDGGDVLRIGKQIFVGRSARSNAAGIEQLQAALAPFGYRVQGVDMRDCLHLKSAVTQVAADTVLINPEWVDRSAFASYQQIEIAPDEPHAANALLVGAAVIYPDNFPRTGAKLRAAGIEVLEVDVSELQKAEGAVTCCSIVLGSD